ncbi:hypothetical protein [Actinocorallia libanotica]|uniref:AMP-binding enzyme n=1 Tax=Actinocorallia libanotica TaxID=46162 RepID=A0ABN1RNP2_9ACTN
MGEPTHSAGQVLGHRHPDVVAAVRARLALVPTATRALANPAAAVVLVPGRSVPKTTSGKIQRLPTRERPLSGELEIIARRGETA